MGYEERRRLGDVRRINDHYTKTRTLTTITRTKAYPTKRRYGLRTVPPIGRVMTINGYIV